MPHAETRPPTRRLAFVAAFALLVAVVVLWPTPAFAQCPMCRRALDSPEGRQMIGALRDGIYVLLAAPFALFGTVAVLAVRIQRRRVNQDV